MNPKDSHVEQIRDLSRKYISDIRESLELSSSVQGLIQRLEQLSDFYHFSPVGYLIMDKKGRVLDANLKACTMLEISYKDIFNQSLFPLVLREDRDALYLHLRRLSKAKKGGVCELRMNSINGRMHHLRLESIYDQDLRGRAAIRTVLLDITDRKNMEEALRRSRDDLEIRVRQRTVELEKANKELKAEIAKRQKFEESLKASAQKIIEQHEQRKYLARRLVDLLEKDRRDVAMMLHDEIGQVMTSVKMDLETTETHLEGNPAQERVARAKNKTVDMLKIIKNISTELRPSPLDSLGLIPSIRSLIEGTKEYIDFDIRFYTKGISKRLDSEKELALYRILQEALTNTAKHSGAREVFVNLIRRDAAVVLTVEDDGRGFDYSEVFKPPQSKEGPLGITIMRERAAQFSGSFRIESQPGKGTHVMVEIPI